MAHITLKQTHTHTHIGTYQKICIQAGKIKIEKYQQAL